MDQGDHKVIRFAALMVPWLMVVWALFEPLILPNAMWMEVRKVFAKNAKVGEPIVMLVDRNVARQFHAQWTVTVRRADKEDSPNFYLVCSGSGQSDYRPDVRFPPQLTLVWWIGHDKCDLPVGAYYIQTSWRFTTLFVERTVSFDSNIFMVTE
jgi:hypothetical protein